MSKVDKKPKRVKSTRAKKKRKLSKAERSDFILNNELCGLWKDKVKDPVKFAEELRIKAWLGNYKL